MCFYNEIVEPPSLWSRGYFPDFNVGLEWVRLYCHEDEAALISITFLTLGCQKQVWTGRLRILLEFGKVGKWDAYSNNCGGVVHFYSLPRTSGRLINLLSRCQELINCCSFSIPCRSPNPAGVLTPLLQTVENEKRRHERCETVVCSIDKSIQKDLMCVACV